ncbi:DoxX family membrane protein [Streptomyces sp. CA-111067]|uniref:DoxX family membrane protein n=1 Tax=Streptomyces sp. CA-111067 TaxID=3240046 RepID=UPI003D951E78
MLASTFINGGLSTVRDPARVAPHAESVTTPLTDRVSFLPKDPEQLVRINGAVQLGAGALLALGRLPRLSAFALALSLVPTTLAGHPYWTMEDPQERAAQRIHFFKNLSMMGGLLIVAADTHGKPSLAYRTRSGTRHAAAEASHRAHAATDAAGNAAGSLAGNVTGAAGSLAGGVRDHLPSR